MTRPVFFYLGDGEYRAPGGYTASFADIFGHRATLRLPDGTVFHGNWKQCRAVAAEHAQHAQENAA